jgi:phage shock protein PspC (stress-responsive transcriptional regulator)
MQTVIIVNLNGNAFHLEEPGYRALRHYLDAAGQQLQDNPDRAEILADLEQAIADKCAHYLQPHKNVIRAQEMEGVLKEMGPVQSDTAAAGGAPGAEAHPDPAGTAANAARGPAPRRLYQIREGAMISGVCAGMAAYFNVDVSIVRIAFVVLAVLTGGLWVLVYLAMMFVIPFANTDEERAAAAGAPFNAQEVIDRAKRHYAQFKDEHEWRRHWRQQRREWRRRWSEGASWWAHNLQRNVYQASTQAGYFGQVFASLLIPVLAVLGMVLFFTFIASLVALSTTGALFGWAVLNSMPLWVACLVLCLVYGAIASQLHNLRRAVYMSRVGFPSPWLAAWDSIFSLGAFFVVGWFTYTHVPQVHDFIQHFPDNIVAMWNNIIESFHHAGSSPPPKTGS